MEHVFWVGPRSAPPQLGELLGTDQAQLHSFDSIEKAVAALGGIEAAVAIITGDWPDAAKAVEAMVGASPGMEILVATDIGMPRQVVLSLWAGAAGVIEFRSQSRQEIVLEIQEWISRSRRTRRERELLLRLHALNEEFLKTIVAAQKKNIELEAAVQVAKGVVAPEDGPAQVLIVDDEQIVHDILKRVLEKRGDNVVSVMDGEAAVKALTDKGFHLVITDKNLPGLSGIDVMKQVKELSPDTAVMMITGYSSKETAVEALDIGAAAYLEKPFDDIKNVLTRITKVIDTQREKSRNKRYLNLIKDRNKDFLDRYRVLRADLETWLLSRGGK